MFPGFWARPGSFWLPFGHSKHQHFSVFGRYLRWWAVRGEWGTLHFQTPVEWEQIFLLSIHIFDWSSPQPTQSNQLQRSFCTKNWFWLGETKIHPQPMNRKEVGLPLLTICVLFYSSYCADSAWFTCICYLRNAVKIILIVYFSRKTSR